MLTARVTRSTGKQRRNCRLNRRRLRAWTEFLAPPADLWNGPSFILSGSGTTYRWLRSNLRPTKWTDLHFLLHVLQHTRWHLIHQQVLSLRRHSLLPTVVHVREIIISLCFDPSTISRSKWSDYMPACTIVAGAAPYGVFPNQPQLYAAQGPPPPTYDQTLTHPMVRHMVKSQ